MLTDAQWAVLEPLIEACRPKGKTPPQDLRRTLEAILWRHDNGAKWRAVAPSGELCLPSLGPGGEPRRPSSAGLIVACGSGFWLCCRSGGVKLGLTFLDGTSLPAHQKAAGAARKGELQRSETIVRRLAALVAAMEQRLAGSQTELGEPSPSASRRAKRNELPHAVPRLDCLPDVPRWSVADRGYSSHAFRQHVWAMGAKPAIPSKRHEVALACPDWVYNNGNIVERLWARLKPWRAVATRYENTAASFMGVLCLAAALNWLKP
jgi:transposase